MAIEEVNKKFSYTTSVISCPKLVSTLNVYNLIYTKLNAYLEVLGGGDEDAVVDLDELAYHLDNIESYYKRVKWFVSETSSKPEEKEPEFNPIAGTQFIDLKKNEEHYSETPEGVPIVFKRNNLFNAQPTLPMIDNNTKFINPFGGQPTNNYQNPWGGGGGFNNPAPFSMGGGNGGFIPL